MACLIRTIQSIGSTFDDTLCTGILVASIEVQDVVPAVTAIKSLSDIYLKWEKVSSRLIEDAANVNSSRHISRVTQASMDCSICGKQIQMTPKCFLSQLNQSSLLKLNKEVEKSVRLKDDNFALKNYEGPYEHRT